MVRSHCGKVGVKRWEANFKQQKPRRRIALEEFFKFGSRAITVLECSLHTGSLIYHTTYRFPGPPKNTLKKSSAIFVFTSTFSKR